MVVISPSVVAKLESIGLNSGRGFFEVFSEEILFPRPVEMDARSNEKMSVDTAFLSSFLIRVGGRCYLNALAVDGGFASLDGNLVLVERPTTI